VDELNKKKRFYALLKEQLFGLVAFPDTCPCRWRAVAFLFSGGQLQPGNDEVLFRLQDPGQLFLIGKTPAYFFPLEPGYQVRQHVGHPAFCILVYRIL
jgi:hypothetical protein